MDVFRQVEENRIICLKTGKGLAFNKEAKCLRTDDSKYEYPVIHDNVPVLLDDVREVQKYLESSDAMAKIYQRMDHEYDTARKPSRLKNFIKNNFWTRLKSNDHRSQASRDWAAGLVENYSDEDVCLSIGGGPNRVAPHFTNVNISYYPNVDVVADAHKLPYADGSVDVIFHEAVLEHLHTPLKAVAEMHRVLKPGGKILSITPFLHEYHGYPYHYCNFTLTGHAHLYKETGFNILDSGTCVGPMHALYSLNLRGMDMFLPPVIKIIAKGIMKFTGILFMRPLDELFNKNPESHILATTTYVAAEKPGSSS